MNPFFSIIIPTYNRAHLISKAIESVIAQTYENWELIIVDDGSTDNTKELIASYQFKDSRIKYIYQENAERSAARNKGIDNAKGQYICFLDSDDYYLPDRLLNIKNELNQKKIEFLFTDIIFKSPEYTFTKFANDFYKSNIFEGVILSLIGTPQVCISKIILIEFKFNPRLIVGEDLELWLRILTKYNIYYLRNEPSVVAFNHIERTVNYSKINSGKLQLKTFKLILSKSHTGKKIPSYLKRQMISDTYFNIFKFYFYNNKRIQCIYFLTRSILANFYSKQLKFRINILLRLAMVRNISKLNFMLENE